MNLRDRLASAIHESWSGWMKYLFEKSADRGDGTVLIPAWAVQRWKRQMETPYEDLPSQEQATDLAEADKLLAVMMDTKANRD